ncbi:hypothetical protein [Spirochaeta africana]|uniref:Histidine kinase n=1 Tax=Spirochaeta africana (strain ATCC 700263 / DSM 8902 / Z-7692) TaxID=889378 RepID=H9ULS5_SPIAZ|nr:hypothetical protein [Spirochaeta africana]AFG38468.1 hypothetical protein Spiaf_2437 [Spirochaeta africana DSM 8902]
MDTTINKARIRQAIEEEKVLSIVTYRYMVHERNYIDHILEMYLREVGRPELQNKLSYCIHELAGNAKKANTKRVYFKEKGLDIHNPTEYHLGMQNFKAETVENIEEYVALQEAADLYVKFQFKREGRTVKIAVRNNAVLTREENERIQQKIRLAREADSLPDIIAQSEDYTEGAGLGLVMSIMMLRNLGISTDNFQVLSRNGETYAVLYLNIPDQPIRKTSG